MPWTSFDGGIKNIDASAAGHLGESLEEDLTLSVGPSNSSAQP